MKIFFILLPLYCWCGLVEEQLAKMSLEEKVGQLFVAPAAPLREEDHWQDWQHLLQHYHVGNALLKASDPASQIRFLQKLPHELLVLADAEWGLGMRMSEAISFPRNLTLGAVQDLTLLEEMGRFIGRQAVKAGIHLNLAPVADVNSNPLNPVIHMRSFGEDPLKAAKRVRALIRGMQNEGLFACAKHFPGHGDTRIDSHEALPRLEQNLERLQSIDLPTFSSAIEEGVECIMSGHLLFSALDEIWPASLSSSCIQGLLREQLGFQGLVITDALNMRALTNHWSVEEIAIRSYEAGHDLLLYGAHLKEDVDELMRNQIPRAIEALLAAFRNGRLSVQELDARVLRILKLKERRRPAEYSALLIDAEGLALKRELFRQALTRRGELPSGIKGYIAVRGKESDWIVQRIQKEGIPVICYQPESKIDLQLTAGWVVGLHEAKAAAEGFGLDEQVQELLKKSPLVILFCTPYALQKIPKGCPALIAYENASDAQEAAWDALQGDLIPLGSLPISMDPG